MYLESSMPISTAQLSESIKKSRRLKNHFYFTK